MSWQEVFTSKESLHHHEDEGLEAGLSEESSSATADVGMACYAVRHASKLVWALVVIDRTLSTPTRQHGDFT